MAMGLTDRKIDAILLALSIGLHQPAESIALLVSFLKSGMPKRQILGYLSLFSCIGPLGLTTGLALNVLAGPLVDATLLAMAAGTFIYVGASEVIPEEFDSPEYKWRKFGALLTGIVGIIAITLYTEQLGFD